MGIGDFLSGVFGSKNEDKAKTHEVDANAYEYGGKPGGADEAAGRYNARSEDWKNKANEYGAQQANLYNQGTAAMNQQQDARGMQMDAASMARARATGQAPSIAQMQGDRAMGQAVSAQASQAASARGPAALALAQQNAGNNMANAQQNIAGQSAIAAAQERQAAEQAYAAQSGAIRGGDQSAAQTSYGAGAQSGQLGLGAGNLGLGYAGMEHGVRQAQAAGAQNREAQKSANANAVSGINAGVGGQNAAMNQSNALGIIGAGAETGAGIATAISDANAKEPATLGSPSQYVPNTWGASPGADEAKQAQALYNAQEEADKASGQLGAIPQRLQAPESVEDRQNNAGGGYMLGQQVGTTLFDGRAQGSLPSGVAAGMKTSGVPEASASKKDRAGAEAATGGKPEGDGKGDAKGGSKIGSVLGGFGSKFGGASKAVDVGYHGSSGGYVPPQLLAVSDAAAKTPVFGDVAGGYAIKDGGLDVMGTFKKQNEEIDRNRRHPGASPMSGPVALSDMAGKQPMMLSDTVGKQPFALSDMIGKLQASDERAKTHVQPEILPLSNRDELGLRLATDDEGRGRYEAQVEASSPVPQKFARMQRDAEEGAKASGGEAPRPAAKAKAVQGSGPRSMTPDEMSAWADRELAKVKREGEARMAQGPAVDPTASRWAGEEAQRARAAEDAIDKGRPAADPMADAARAMRASTYAYKPEMTPPEQRPGEPNVGPMAQTMASNPVTATAIKQDPKSGMLMIDQSKMLKVLGGVAAHQQNQIDALARTRRKG